MKHIVLPDHHEHRLIFYLALEEFVAHEPDENEAFFIWQVAPTVIFGRNQLMEAEVNVPYCKEHGINLFRRKSGGGCVYSDRGNLMFSYITKGEDIGFIFDRYIRRVALLLQRIGINAQVSGRNDILIDGKKVSGNAFYRTPGKSIVHGTLLFDTDFEQMERALTPSGGKLKSKGVASVRQHVTNLKEHTGMDIEEFKAYVISKMCDGERCLTDAEIKRIEEIEQTYLDESFFSGRNPSYTIEKFAKIKDAGEIAVQLELRNGAIRNVHLSGDFFLLQDTEQELNRRLHGQPYTREAVEQAMESMKMESYILNLSTADWIDLLMKP